MLQKRFIRFLLTTSALIIAFIMIAFSSVYAEEDEEVTILFTHDLHDNLYSFPVMVEGEAEYVGGYARLFTAIEEERKKHANTVLVDAGDYAMGTLFQTVFATESPTLRLMGTFGYDAVTFGNHEFDFRADGLADSLLAAKESDDRIPDIVMANMTFPTLDDGSMDEGVKKLKEATEAYGVKPYKVIERNGISIGIFGLLGEDAASNAPMSGVEFEPIIDTAKEVVRQLKDVEGVDLIIALSHSGTSENKKTSEDELLAEAVPEIDVIVSGHSHTFLENPIVVGNTVIGSTGEYGENLGVLTLEKGNDRWELVDYKLKRIDNSIEENRTIIKQIEVFKHNVQKEYLDYFDLEFNEVLGRIPYHITEFETIYERHEEDPLGSLIGDAYLYTVREHDEEDVEPVTAAIVPVGTIRSSLYEGEITVSDVFNVSSLGIGKDKMSGYPLVEVFVTGKELKTIAEVDASVAPLMPAAQLHVAGLTYTFNPHRLFFNKVTDVKIRHDDGSTEEIVDDNLYRVVAGLYAGQMLPVVNDQSFGLLSVEPKDRDGNPITDFEDHILYMNDGSEREIKEWYAIANYIRSFPKVNGLPQVSDEYKELQGRKIVEASRSIPALLEKPNGIAYTVYGLILVGLVALLLVTRFIIRRVRRRRELKQAS